jgi:hypothetical protein
LALRLNRRDEPLLPCYQILDLMCPFERTTMSTIARSKKLVVV